MKTDFGAARASFLATVAATDDAPVAVGLVDLDGFREFNERHGSEAGDELIATVEEILREWLPDGGLLVRLGGDEFGVLLTETPEDAFLRMEDARRALNAKRHTVAGQKRSIPASIGIAAFPHHVEDAADLPRAADDALQRAKRSGRNRVCLWVDEKMVLKSNYYTPAQLGRLAEVARRLGRTEASLLREALEALLEKNRDL